MTENSEKKNYKCERAVKEKDGKIYGVSYRFNYDDGTYSLLNIKREDRTAGNGAVIPSVIVSVFNIDKSRATSLKINQCTEKNIGTIDGLMEIYYNAKKEKEVHTEHSGSMICKFMDRYFFNTENNRELLQEYLQQKEPKKVVLTHAADKPSFKNLWNIFSKKNGKDV